MTASATTSLAQPRSAGAAARFVEGSAGVSDDWPNTTRVLPWFIAVFVAMLYLVPFDSIYLPISLPVNSGLDRFVLGALFLVWAAVYLAGRARPQFKHAPLNAALWAFIVLCVLSIAVNLRDLTWEGDLSLSVKQLSLVGSYTVFFFIVATSIRRTEVAAYSKFMVVLAVISALGTIYQYRSGTNLFYELARSIFAGATVTAPPTASASAGARSVITGPTTHGLADTTLLSVAVPFAMIFASQARDRWRGLAWVAATTILIAGCVATQRKTALIVIVVSVVVVVAYEPRRYVRYWPLLPLIVLAVRALAPHSISALIYQLNHLTSGSSTTTRTSDYSAVAPYIDSHLLLGRGYGSFSPTKYRILDNQILGWLIEIGIFGALAYTSVMVAAAATVHRAARRAAGLGDLLMRGVVAVSACFFVSNFLYDAFGFRAAVYVFFFIAGMGAAYGGRTASEEVSGALPTPSGPLWRGARWFQTAKLFSGGGTAPVAEPVTTKMPRTGPAVSVLIITYRNPEVTRQCLRSVLDHVRGVTWELLVLDNASGDGTEKMIQDEFPQIALQVSDENLGFARGMNELAERAKGQYLLLLNPDTIMHPQAVNELLSLAHQHPEGGIYGGRTVSDSGELDPSSCWGTPSLWSLWCFATGISSVFRRSRLFNPESLGRWRRDSVRTVGVVTGCLALISAELWRSIDGFDEDFWMYGEDADLCMRLADLGYRPMITPAATITHHVGASSSAGEKSTMILGAKAKLIRKHWPAGRARLGVWLLKAGCALRAWLAGQSGWAEAWRRRREWSRQATSRSGAGHA